MISEAAFGLFVLLLKDLAPLGGTGLLGALIYVLWRTGSGHLLRRLWLVAYGKERLFLASVTDVRGVRPNFLGERPTLTVEICRQDAAHVGFKDVDAAALCEFLKAPNIMASIAEAARAQRAFLALVAVASVFMFAHTLMNIRQFSLVLQMRQRLLERSMQISLPF